MLPININTNHVTMISYIVTLPHNSKMTYGNL